MSNYQIRFSKKLSTNPKPFGYKKLKKHEGNKIRIGDYRAIYTIKENKLIELVLTIGHRKDVYE